MPRAWIDVSLPIEPGSVAWQGIPGAELKNLASIEMGDAVTVSQLDCCLHTGTHADAPSHVQGGGLGVDRMPVEAYIGPARLIRIDSLHCIGKRELAAAGIERLKGRPSGERILFCTPQQFDGKHFPDRIPHLEPEAAELLGWLGARLVGVNVPSLDPLSSTAMTAHKLIFGAGAAVLENLVLEGLAPGDYELSAAPIRVAAADAAPVRALLRPMSGLR